MTAWLLLLVLAGTPQDGFAIILGGGKTEEEARQAEQKWLSTVGADGTFIRRADGWPKVVDSGSDPGRDRRAGRPLS